MAGNEEKMSVIRVMTDKNGWEKEKSVLHKSHDGQKRPETRKKCPS
ncbi:hypothetical protein [Bacillus sp. ISL-55]|nr:hypothetical protein [Bacillus sp. ISL-55]